MNAADLSLLRPHLSLDASIDAACRSIAPTWPLDRFVAVNPWWERIGQPFDRVDTDLRRRLGSGLRMSRDYYRSAWRDGRIRREHLVRAMNRLGHSTTVEALVAALDEPQQRIHPLPLLSDCLDAVRDLQHEPAWREVIAHQISQFCAAWFDTDQADWRPGQQESLYGSWHQAIGREHGISLLMHAPEISQRAKKLPANARDLIAFAVAQLAMPNDQVQDLLEVTLLRINGWAAWCAYLRWEARLQDADDAQMVDLLAIRLAWECLLDDGARDADSVWQRWQKSWARALQAPVAESAWALAVWQLAQEMAFQQPLLGELARPADDTDTAADVQAVFCLDVRSEPLRRALEQAHPAIQTMGFAGFFGIPVHYTPLGTGAGRPQLPGLLAPGIEMTDSSGNQTQDQAIADRRRKRLHAKEAEEPFHRLPGSAFTLVESLGITYLGKLIRRSLPGRHREAAPHQEGLTPAESRQIRPQLLAMGLEQRADLAERVLRTLCLTEGFARLVVFVGHGSHSSNNPHASGLDCGACGGQSGEGNARALAELLNNAAVRQALAERGIHIPPATHFMAGLHQTTTDDVSLFDGDRAPVSHTQDVQRLQQALLEAGEQCRAERAPRFGLSDLASQPQALARAFRARAADWAQTRPEWGLAGNAAFVVAPRARTRGIDLGGRVFLQDYAWQRDPDGSVLEAIMTGPMIVAHWINMQYYASMVDNRHFGSGNKLLHNVVGGRIGVFEGNGGDLRIGLPRQSLHDGKRWMHEPLRLSVMIDAPRKVIETIKDRHESVRQLIDNHWLHLFRMEGETVEYYQDGQWVAW
jgi:uncharacterized protein